MHKVIMDIVTGKHGSDFACLDPRSFTGIRERGLPESALQELSKCLLKFDARTTVGTLQAELSSLATQWKRLKMSPLEEYKVRSSTGDAPEDR